MFIRYVYRYIENGTDKERRWKNPLTCLPYLQESTKSSVEIYCKFDGRLTFPHLHVSRGLRISDDGWLFLSFSSFSIFLFLFFSLFRFPFALTRKLWKKYITPDNHFCRRSKKNDMTEFFQRVPTVGGICRHLKARIIDTIMFRDGITVEVVFKHVKILNFSVHYLHYVSYFKTHLFYNSFSILKNIEFPRHDDFQCWIDNSVYCVAINYLTMC